jgi:hypothetical protein
MHHKVALEIFGGPFEGIRKKKYQQDIQAEFLAGFEPKTGDFFSSSI